MKLFFLFLVQLWKYSILHFAHVIQQINPEKLGNKWISKLVILKSFETYLNILNPPEPKFGVIVKT